MNARPRPLMTLPRRAEYGNLRVDGVDDDPFGQYRTRKPVTASRGSGTFHVRSNPPQWPATGRRSRGAGGARLSRAVMPALPMFSSLRSDEAARRPRSSPPAFFAPQMRRP